MPDIATGNILTEIATVNNIGLYWDDDDDDHDDDDDDILYCYH